MIILLNYMEINSELIEQIRKYALSAEKPERYAHSIRVAETAGLMCGLYGIDAKKGYLAGLAHDICKDLDDASLLTLASCDKMPISELEQKRPSLLHGRAAAQKLKLDYKIDDEDILQAVACHTLGGEGICSLAKVIYAADKIEPGRPQSSESYRLALFIKPLNELCLSVLEENIAYLRSKGKQIAPSTFRFKESLK